MGVAEGTALEGERHRWRWHVLREAKSFDVVTALSADPQIAPPRVAAANGYVPRLLAFATGPPSVDRRDSWQTGRIARRTLRRLRLVRELTQRGDTSVFGL